MSALSVLGMHEQERRNQRTFPQLIEQWGKNRPQPLLEVLFGEPSRLGNWSDTNRGGETPPMRSLPHVSRPCCSAAGEQDTRIHQTWVGLPLRAALRTLYSNSAVGDEAASFVFWCAGGSILH